MTIGGEQLYASLVLRPSLPVERAAELTLVAAVALAETLESFGAHPRIKWPNDLELDDRKVAGLLCEMATDDAGRLSHIVIGVGVNLEGDLATLPADLCDRATTLQAVLGRAPTAESLSSTFCRRLEGWLSLHSTEGLSPVLQAWRERSSTLGQRVRVTLGSSAMEGTALDIDADGALIIETQGSRVRVQAGEVERLRLSGGGG